MKLSPTVALIVGMVPLVAWAAPDGGALFGQHCAICHRADGSGTVGLAPPVKGDHWQKLGVDRGYLLTVITQGLSGPISVGGVSFVGSMPSLAAQLDDEAIAAIATHLRALQGAADAPPYTAPEVAAARSASGGPAQTRQRRTQLLGK